MTRAVTLDVENRASGPAALAICEALILALVETNTLSGDQACGLLCDAEAAYRYAPAGPKKALHEAVVVAIEGVRRSVTAATIPRVNGHRHLNGRDGLATFAHQRMDAEGAIATDGSLLNSGDIPGARA
jgi:hypothetical protein